MQVEFTIVFYISLALLGLILLLNVRCRPSAESEKGFFDRIISKEIQGFLAVFIIFHQTEITLEHLEAGTRDMFQFADYKYYGILAVAFFFFSSGFGLIKRWMTDESYIKGFMKRRTFTVLVPFFICNYIYLTDALLGNIREGKSFKFVEVICSFFGLFLINNQMWFAVEIMILYIVFRIVFSRVKKAGTGILIMTFAVLIMMAIGFLSGHSDSMLMSYWFKGEWWYNTLLMFPVGMFYAYKEERINKVINRAYAAILIGASVLLVIMDFIHRNLIDNLIYWTEFYGSNHPYIDKLAGLGVETVLEIVFLIVVITIISRLKFGNPVLKFLGKISLETIMINYLICDKFYFIYSQFGLYAYMVAVLAGTIVAASVVYLVKNIVLERRTGLFDGDVR